MTSTYDSTGIDMDTGPEVFIDLKTGSKEQWGESINMEEDELLGHMTRQLARLVGDTNLVFQNVVDAINISAATGTILDFLVALIGLERQSAAFSTVTLTLTATEATTVPIGTQYATAAEVVFATDAAVVFTGAGSQDVAATCTVAGSNDAGINEVIIIKNSVFGISSVTNAAAATPGRLRETSPELRARHTTAVATSGDQDMASIKEAVEALTGVSAVYAFENDTDAAIDSVPARTIYITVIGGNSTEIATEIAQNKTASVATHGSTTVAVTDSDTGQTKDINFGIAADLDIHISVTLTTIPGVFPDDGSDQIKALLVADFSTLSIADDVQFNRIYKSIYGVAGVSGISNLFMGTVDPPAGTIDITVTQLQRAVLVAGDIDITVS